MKYLLLIALVNLMLTACIRPESVEDNARACVNQWDNTHEGITIMPYEFITKCCRLERCEAILYSVSHGRENRELEDE